MKIKNPAGLLPSSPRRREDHPGIKGWLPPYHINHADIPFSGYPQNIQGTPRRLFTRSGARPAYTAMHAPPANFAFLIETIRQQPGGGAPLKQLVAQSQLPIGIVH